MKKGEYKIIRVDGTETIVSQCPTLNDLRRAIGCDLFDTVTLDRQKQTVMLVDDTGMVDEKPVNDKATALCREVFGPQYPHCIHGDVAIVNDEDFA